MSAESKPEQLARIVIGEDEQVVALDLQKRLLALGYCVAGVADTGPEVIRLAQELSANLVLMDIRLRGSMDGIEAAEVIRQELQIPVIFLTAYASKDTVARARIAGPLGYLTKPFRINELNATILMALDQHKLGQNIFAERGWLVSLLGSISDGVIATDASGCIRVMNSAAAQMTGWTQSEALGKQIEAIYTLETLSGEPLVECQLRTALQDGVPIPKQRFALRTRQGGLLAIEDAAAPVLSDGLVIGAVSVFLDISATLQRESYDAALRLLLEEQVQQTTEALGHTRAELKTLSGYLITAQDEERRRVARELHDDLGQRTALLEFDLERVSRHLTRAAPEARLALESLHTHISALAAGLREVSHRLHPSVLTDLGLEAALRTLVQEHVQRGGDASIVVPDNPNPVPADVATAMYRVAQEAFRNVVKHTDNAPVRITLEDVGKELRLTIEDAGPGFELRDFRGKGGLGLLSMQERARLVGGTLQLQSQLGDGTKIVFRVPVQEAVAAN
ncbi:MAG: response regulator [Bryobacteraceae bacterium]|nr:response regulator [Bryobacteraceae bacterium]